MKTLTSLSEQDDLLITPYLDKAGLPTILRDLMPLASTSSQQDMLLLSVLTAAGSAMPRTYFTYGHTRRAYYPNLICFIEAMAAQGKSIASVGQQLLRKVNEDEPIFLAADSTHAAFVQHLSEQNGVGFCYESEGSVITDIWRRSGCNGYNALLRKAAEHEEYRVSRKTQPDIVIRNPRLSMLITGTFDQFTARLKDVAILHPTDVDFQTAMLIGRKLLLHAADAYTQINADQVTAIPAARGSFQQLTFLAALPKEFSTEECMKTAVGIGVTERSVARWLATWVQDGTLMRPSKGFYRKVA